MATESTRGPGAMTEVKLLPCPFCGGEARTYFHVKKAARSVRCLRCEAQMPYVAFTRDGAIASWNTRHCESATAERDALLRDALGLLEANVRTKSRDDHAEQKLIVRIRQALAGGRDER